mmetsp:Transcript_11572/g.21886  ORF Transcript_11572/g.21886 Transcript_11572/m.21886 type:complete len:217 (+) Transcript_11572:1172-1822(+)
MNSVFCFTAHCSTAPLMRFSVSPPLGLKMILPRDTAELSCTNFLHVYSVQIVTNHPSLSAMPRARATKGCTSPLVPRVIMKMWRGYSFCSRCCEGDLPSSSVAGGRASRQLWGRNCGEIDTDSSHGQYGLLESRTALPIRSQIRCFSLTSSPCWRIRSVRRMLHLPTSQLFHLVTEDNTKVNSTASTLTFLVPSSGKAITFCFRATSSSASRPPLA